MKMKILPENLENFLLFRPRPITVCCGEEIPLDNKFVLFKVVAERFISLSNQ